MKKVLIFGAFDLLHPGHLDFFRQAKELGDHLVVVVGTDKNVTKTKGKKPLQNESVRLRMVVNAPHVDEAYLGDKNFDYIKTIKKLNPGIICLGYDQQPSDEELSDELKNHDLASIKIIRLKPYKDHIFKSTKIKETFAKD